MSFKKEELEYISLNIENLKCLDFQLEEEDKRRSRNQYKRDYTRVLYSSSFRRLQGKMQLLGVDSDQFYRNRLTHSLEVAQIARSIAELCNYKSSDLYVVELGALAHDIGNPPFGHYGEEILDYLCSDMGGFEGNAQTFRVLTELEKKNPESRGLNLSLRSLLSIVKYYNCKSSGSKKFLYDNSYNLLQKWIIRKDILMRTLDVQIVDLADEIAYAAHDLEDALSQGLFTVDELVYEFKQLDNNSENYIKSYETLIEIVNEAKKFASQSSLFKSSEEYSFILRKEITSIVVNKLIEDIGLIELTNENKNKTGSLQSHEIGFKNLAVLAEGLKKITFKTINRKNHIQIYEKLGEKVIKGLFNVFMDEKFNKDCLLMPVEYRPISDTDCRCRLVIDYISGMMDSYAIHTYEKYYGKLEKNNLYCAKYYD